MIRFFKTSLLLTMTLLCLCTASIHPANPFNAVQDAQILRKAMKGWGTDEESITNVLTHRSREQRLAIPKAFYAEYKRDLIEDLKDELSGDYLDLILALMTPLPDYYVKVLYKAAENSDSEAIVDILLTSSNAELNAINEAYKQLYINTQVELPMILTRKNQQLSHNMIWRAFEGARNENQVVNVRDAIDAAKFLNNIGEHRSSYLRTWTEEKAVENIFVTSSYIQLRQVFEEYENLYGHNIREAFKHRGFNSDLENGILHMNINDKISQELSTGLYLFNMSLIYPKYNKVSVIESTPDYYAKRLHESMVGLGTNDKMLIRIIVGRSEIDLDAIREAFQKNYRESLSAWIAGDTSGDFRRALLAIVES